MSDLKLKFVPNTGKPDFCKKIFIPEINDFGLCCTIALSCSNWDSFFSVWDIETLERLCRSAEDDENYEMATIIIKHIQIKKRGTCGSPASASELTGEDNRDAAQR